MHVYNFLKLILKSNLWFIFTLCMPHCSFILTIFKSDSFLFSHLSSKLNLFTSITYITSSVYKIWLFFYNKTVKIQYHIRIPTFTVPWDQKNSSEFNFLSSIGDISLYPWSLGERWRTPLSADEMDWPWSIFSYSQLLEDRGATCYKYIFTQIKSAFNLI